MTELQPLSVSQVTEHIRRIMECDGALRRVFIRGELSNYKIHSSGHHYFTLKDAGASIRCVMFRSDAAKLRFRPEDGMGVVCSGRIDVYAQGGTYQLYASSIQPEGMGNLYAAFERLKAKLLAEGLFEREHKKPLPPMPKRIALITSGTGAAVRDMIRVLGRRWPLAEIVILPVRVQGAEAPAEIAGAIRYANRWSVAELIITGRGGGSMEDLWAFNDERVARAIFASDIPVISAVGHEPDVTIADFVADVRAATPSNGAELAVPDQTDVRAALLSMEKRLRQAERKRLELFSARLRELSSRQVMQSPTAFLQNRRIDLDRRADRMQAAQKHLLLAKRQEFVRLVSSLEAMSPLKVLSRGFSVTTDDSGAVIRSAASVAPGDKVHIRLEHGALDCRVEHSSEVRS